MPLGEEVADNRKKTFKSFQHLQIDGSSMSDRYRGVTSVAILTLLGGVCLFLYSIMIVALGAMGHAGTYTDPAALLRLQHWPFPLLLCHPSASSPRLGFS